MAASPEKLMPEPCSDAPDWRAVVRPKCYLTLTIDHRALDAFQANAFLTHFVDALEQWT
jgi:pyruvate/2-oxoglutarate dehydrogenase complex dihydrolipoamide acyltransferase (E2) component